MYLAEVNEEVLRKHLMEEGYDEGYEEGQQNLLAELITKKIKAGKPLEQIASEVEEPVDAIQELYYKLKSEFNSTN